MDTFGEAVDISEHFIVDAIKSIYYDELAACINDKSGRLLVLDDFELDDKQVLKLCKLYKLGLVRDEDLRKMDANEIELELRKLNFEKYKICQKYVEKSGFLMLEGWIAKEITGQNFVVFNVEYKNGQ